MQCDTFLTTLIFDSTRRKEKLKEQSNILKEERARLKGQKTPDAKEKRKEFKKRENTLKAEREILKKEKTDLIEKRKKLAHPTRAYLVGGYCKKADKVFL